MKLLASRRMSSGVSVLLPSALVLAARMCLYDEIRNPAVPQAGVENPLILLGIYDRNYEVDDVPRGSELPGVSLRSEDGQQVLERVAEPL